MNKTDIFTKTYLNIIKEEVSKDIADQHDKEFIDACINTLKKALKTNDFNKNADAALSLINYYIEQGAIVSDEEKEIIENAKKLKHGKLK